MAESNVEMVKSNPEIMKGSNSATAVEEEILDEVLLCWGESCGDSGCEKDTVDVEAVEVLEELGQEEMKLKGQEKDKSQQQHTMDQEETKDLEGKMMMSKQNTNNGITPDYGDNEPCPSSAPENEDEELFSPPECRICSFEAEPDHPLFYPCACSGSIRWVHQDCLEHWLKVKNLSTEQCEVCEVPFHFTPVYKEGTPIYLAPCEFILGVLTRIKQPILFTLRIGYAIILWGGILPFCTVVISRIYFCTSMQDAFTVIYSMTHSSLHALLGHIALGIGLCILIMAILSILPLVIVNGLHNILGSIILDIGSCFIILVILSTIPLATVKWISSVMPRILDVSMLPQFLTLFSVLYVWRKSRRVRRWIMNLGSSIVKERGERQQSGVTIRRNIRQQTYQRRFSRIYRGRRNCYHPCDIDYNCAAGILFVGTKKRTPPEVCDEEQEEIAAAVPPPRPLNDAIINRIMAMNVEEGEVDEPHQRQHQREVAAAAVPHNAPLSAVIVNHINAINPPDTFVIPGIGSVNLNKILGTTRQIASPILKPLLSLTCEVLFIMLFLGVFQLIPFRVGCAALEPWNTSSRGTTVPGSRSSRIDYGEILSHNHQQQQQQQRIPIYHLTKFVIDRFLGMPSVNGVGQEPPFSNSSHLSQFFSCDWLGKGLINTSTAITEREKMSLQELELSNKFCAVGLGYGLIFAVISLLLFMFLLLFTIKRWITKATSEADGTEGEGEELRSARNVVYDKLALFVQQAMTFLKVSLFILIDVTLIPLWVGSIMDLFTLQALQSSVEDRLVLLRDSPALFLSFHWLVGAICTVGTNTALLEVRKVISTEWLRDWLPRNDQVENPEHLLVLLANVPFVRQFERTMLSFVRFVPILFLSLYLPLQASWLLPGVSRPFQLGFSEAYVEVPFPMELLLLHFIFPVLIDKISARQTIQKLICWFFISACRVLELDEILIDADVLQVWREEHNENVEQQGQEQQQQQQQQHREQQHHHNAQEQDVVDDEDERQPLVVEESIADEHQLPSGPSHDSGSPSPNRRLLLRLLLLGVASCVWLTVTCFVGIHLPLIMGRGLFLFVGFPIVSDCYTIAIGLILSWGLFSGIQYFFCLFTQLGTATLVESVKIWFMVGIKWLVLCTVWLILAPLLVGSLFEVVLITPVFHPLDETPRVVIEQDWALGLVALKMWMQFTIMGAMAHGGRPRGRVGDIRGGGEVMDRQVVAHLQRGRWGRRGQPSLTWSDRLEKVFNNGVRGVIHMSCLILTHPPSLLSHCLFVWVYVCVCVCMCL